MDGGWDQIFPKNNMNAQHEAPRPLALCWTPTARPEQRRLGVDVRDNIPELGQLSRESLLSLCVQIFSSEDPRAASPGSALLPELRGWLRTASGLRPSVQPRRPLRRLQKSCSFFECHPFTLTIDLHFF